MSITVLKPGLLSSFQDVGRDGFQHQGVPVTGAMDAAAHQLVNALVGNTEDLATLEITLFGPSLRFDNAACFGLAGADLGATLNNKAIAQHRPLIAQAGDVLRFGSKPPKGVRTYLAVHGGYAISSVMATKARICVAALEDTKVVRYKKMIISRW
jgi:antagonist of KipI